MFVDPSKDWLTHMMQLKPIDNPRGVAGLAKQKFAASYQEFDDDPRPLTPSALTANVAPTATSCTMLMTASCWWLQHTSVLTCPLPKRNEAIAAVRLVAAPIECNTTYSIPYTQRKCKRCKTGVDNEHYLLFECRCPALPVIRAKHSALFDGISDVRQCMAAAYKPE
jgi:hypothetical protein